jgi:hypothetical protein
MTKRGGIAGTAPNLRQRFRPIPDLSEGEAPFGANTAEQRAKAFHCHLQIPYWQGAKLSRRTEVSESAAAGYAPRSFPRLWNWSTHRSWELLTQLTLPALDANNPAWDSPSGFGVALATGYRSIRGLKQENGASHPVIHLLLMPKCYSTTRHRPTCGEDLQSGPRNGCFLRFFTVIQKKLNEASP